MAAARDLIKMEQQMTQWKKKYEGAEDEIKDLKAKVSQHDQALAAVRRSNVEAGKEAGKNSKVTEKYHQLLKERDHWEGALKKVKEAHQAKEKDFADTQHNWERQQKHWISEFAELEKGRDELLVTKAALEGQISSLTEDVNNQDTINKKTAGELRSVKENKSMLETQLSAAQDEVEALKQHVAQQEKELFNKAEELTGKIDEKNVTLKSAQEKEAQATAMVNQLTANLDSTKKSKAQVEKDLSELTSRSNTLDTEHRQALENLFMAKRELDTCNKQLELEKQSAADFRGRFQSAEEQLALKTEELHNQHQSQNELIKGRSELWSELQQSTTRIGSLEKTEKRQIDQVEKLTGALHTTERALETATRDFQAQQSTWTATEERLQGNISALEKALSSEKDISRSLDANRQTSLDSIAVATANFKQMNEKIAETEQENSNLRRELTTAEREVSNLSITVEGLTTKLATSQEEKTLAAQMWTTQSAEAQSQIGDLRKSLTDSQGILKERDVVQERILVAKEEEIHSLEQDKVELQKTVADIETALKHCHQQLDLKADECEKLEKVKAGLTAEVDVGSSSRKELLDTMLQEQELLRTKATHLAEEITGIRAALRTEESNHLETVQKAKTAQQDLEKELHHAKSNLQAAEDQVQSKAAELNATLDKTSTSDVKLHAQIAGLQTTIDSMTAEKMEKSSAELTLRKELALHKQAKAEADAAILKSEGRVSELLEELKNSRNVLATMQEEKDHTEKQHRSQTVASKVNDAKHKGEVDQLKSDVERLNFHWNESKERHVAAEAEVRRLNGLLEEGHTRLGVEITSRKKYKEGHATVVERLIKSQDNRKEENGNAQKLINHYRAEKRLLAEKFDKLKVMFEELRDDAALPPSSRTSKRSVAFAQVCDDAERCANSVPSQGRSVSSSLNNGFVLSEAGDDEAPPFKKARYESYDKENMPSHT